MGRELYSSIQSFRLDINHYDRLGEALGYQSVKAIFTGADIGAFPPLTVQLTFLYLQMALVRLWRAWGVNPCAVVGHSLGQYAALHAAGVISDADVIYLVGRRALLLQEKFIR